ncbi:hypothetical protein DPEC_G00119130, partial [Dallia pectoralis]
PVPSFHRLPTPLLPPEPSALLPPGGLERPWIMSRFRHAVWSSSVLSSVCLLSVVCVCGSARP